MLDMQVTDVAVGDNLHADVIEKRIVEKIGRMICDELGGQLRLQDLSKVVSTGLNLVTSFAPYTSVAEKVIYMKSVMSYVLKTLTQKGYQILFLIHFLSWHCQVSSIYFCRLQI